MVRKSLLAASLIALATPLAAQQTYTWSSNRPDAIAPGGVTGAQILKKGRFEISYQFIDVRYKGVWYQTDSLPLATTLSEYSQAPLQLSEKTHRVSLAWGASDNLTLLADVGYTLRTREQAISDSTFYVTNSKQIGDLRLLGLYRFYNQGGYEGHFQIGVLVPTGGVDVKAVTPFSNGAQAALPYDMQGGAGTFAILPGLTAQAQNDIGSVGAQAKGTFYVGTNSAGYRLGNVVEMTGWASVRINDYFSASARLDWQDWGKIQGARAGLDPTQDPGNDAYSLDGQILELPFGINFYLPEKSRFAGQRITLEATKAVYHNFDGPNLGLDWALHLGWQMGF